MRKSSKVFALVLALVMIFSLIPLTSISAASQPEYLYLTPNANWKQSNARFAAYFFGNGETWVSMTDTNKDGVYEVKVPTTKTYPNVIFCRMNPSATANNWNNKWNQTADLTIPTSGSNHYTVKEGTWDKGGGTWSTFGSTCMHTNLGTAATCTTPQLCLDCGDPVVSELGHAYNSAHLCTRCNGQATFTVAGSGAHLGTEWDTGNKANDMTYADGVYTKVYTNVAAGSYAFKVARDHDWGTAYPAADKTYTVATTGSTVTITLKGTTVDVKVEAPHTCEFSEPTCTEPGKCSCGLTQGEALGHDIVVDEAKAPTCTETGLTAGEHCSRCDAMTVAQEEVPATGHVYVLDMCYVCYDVKCSLALGENTITVAESETLAMPAGMFQITEAGTYKISGSEGSIVCIFTDRIGAEGSDFTVSGAGSWLNYAAQAELEVGYYYYAVYNAGVHTVTLEVVEDPAPVVKNTVALGDNHYVVTDDLIATGFEWHLLEITEAGTYVVTGGAPMTIFVFHDPYVGEALDATAPYTDNVDDLTYDYIDSFEVDLAVPGFYWVGFRYDNVGDLREFDFNIALKVEEPAPEHTCESVCAECGKCTDAECTEAACADKCAGHTEEPKPEDPQPPVDEDPTDPQPEPEELGFFEKIIALLMQLIELIKKIFGLA